MTEGNVDIEITFDPKDLKKNNKTFDNIKAYSRNWHPVWEDIAEVVKESIATNILKKQSPDGTSWPRELNVGIESPIWNNYVRNPNTGKSTPTHFIYEPGLIEFSSSSGKGSMRYHLFQRAGYHTKNGRFMPGCEWFGIRREGSVKIEQIIMPRWARKIVENARRGTTGYHFYKGGK